VLVGPEFGSGLDDYKMLYNGTIAFLHGAEKAVGKL